MCPLCLSTTTLALVGLASTGGLAGLVVKRLAARTASRSDDVEETTQNRISDGNRNRRTGRTHFCAARKTRSCLKRDAADCDGIDVAMHFEDERFRPIPFDNQGRVDRRQRTVAETHVDDSTSNRHDRSQ